MDWKQMGRAKIPIKWISKDTPRNVTFMKRKKGLRKKIEELSILCGVEACMVCFEPHTDEQQTFHEQSPDVWPNMSKALEVIERYRRLSKEEQDKKKLDNSSFLEQRIKKLMLELNMKRKENRDLEMESVYMEGVYPSWDNSFNCNLLEYIDVKLEAVRERINFLAGQEQEAGNNIAAFTDMEYIDRKPLMEPPYTSQRMVHDLMMPMPMPHQSQESLSLTVGNGNVHPYASLEEQCYKNSIGKTALDYLVKANPKALDHFPVKANPMSFTAVKDCQHTPHFMALGNNYETEKDNVEMAAIGNIHLDRNFYEGAHLPTRKGFPLISDHHVQSNDFMAEKYSTQWTTCCTVYCPCPRHFNMGFQLGPQTATIQELQVSGEPQQHQQFLVNNFDGCKIYS